MVMQYARPELELKRRAPLAGGQAGTHEFVRTATVIIGFSDTADFTCAGTADDVEILAAITYVGALGGGELRLLGGNYDITSEIIDGGFSDIIFGGVGWVTVLTAANGFNAEVIELTSVSGWVLRDFVVDGNKANQSAGNCVRLDTVTEFLIDHVRAQNAYLNNFDLLTSSRGEIVACIGNAGRNDGLSMEVACHHIVVRGGEYYGNTGTTWASGIEIRDGVYDVILIGPRCHDNQYRGIEIKVGSGEDPPHDIVLVAPNCYNHADSGIYIYVESNASDSIKRISIHQPNLHDNEDGIYANAEAGELIEDIEVSGGFSQSNTRDGVRLPDRVKNFHVRGTDLSGNAGVPFNVGTTCINCFVGQPESLLPSFWMQVGNDVTIVLNTAGRVYLTPIQLEEGMVASALLFSIGGVSAGNVHIGIYGSPSMVDPRTPAGGDLLADTGSIATPATWRWLRGNITDVYLPPGLYWLAVESDQTIIESRQCRSTYKRDGLRLVSYYYDRAGGYGALTDPCPSVTEENEAPDYLMIQSPP